MNKIKLFWKKDKKFILGVCGAILFSVFSFFINLYKREKILKNPKITVIEYLEKTPAATGSFTFDFKGIIENKEQIISFSIFKSNFKKNNCYLLIYENGNPSNYTVTTYEVDYEVGACLDSVYSIKKLDSLGYLAPIF